MDGSGSSNSGWQNVVSMIQGKGERFLRDKAWFAFGKGSMLDDPLVKFEMVSDQELKFVEHDLFGTEVMRADVKYVLNNERVEFEMDLEQELKRKITGWIGLKSVEGGLLEVYLPWKLVENEEKEGMFLRIFSGYVLLKKAKVENLSQDNPQMVRIEKGLSGEEEAKMTLKLVEAGNLLAGTAG